MKNILLKIQFKGTKFFGTQIQKNKRTVQGEIEKVLNKIFGEKTKTICCSRLDKGVHAREFFINFFTSNLKISLKELKKALNYYLDKDIRVFSVKGVDKNFNSRFNAKSKIYRYFIYNGEILSPFRKELVYHYPYKLDFDKMKKSLKYFSGKRDFRNFSAKSDKTSTICNVFNLKIKKNGKIFYIEIEGDRFLYKMVRTIASAILKIGSGKLKLEDINKIFKGKIKTPEVLPAEGLYLWKVNY